jgi:hypothetical protein
LERVTARTLLIAFSSDWLYPPTGSRDRARRSGDSRGRPVVPVRRDQREGARIATDGGVTVIMDRGLKVEHARYVGRMHWLGFNTRRITSVRSGLQ